MRLGHLLCVWSQSLADPKLFPRRPHVNGRIIHLGRRLLDHPDVVTIPLTDEVLDA